MEIIIVEQFNPMSQCWNKLYEVEKESFDPDAPFTVDKYGGPYRTRTVGTINVVEEIIIEDLAEELVAEITEEEPKEVNRKKFFQTFGDDQD